MSDVLTREQRHLNMSRIRAKDTKPEMLLRRGLHAKGFRYQLHRRNLPGCPDLVLPGYQAVIFVHGCFWHGHGCPLFRLPATRTDFWLKKIVRNGERDKDAIEHLKSEGWRILTVWECALRGASRLTLETVLRKVESFLKSKRDIGEISGTVAVTSAMKPDSGAL
jgi:DNA mismatch endonuclease (patch repair protein)